MSSWWGDDGFQQPAVTEALRLGASQDGWELGMALLAITELNPAVVVEIGCDRGGTLYAWRSVCPNVYGITLADNSPETGGSGLDLVQYDARVLIGDSHDPAARAWLIERLICDDNPTVAHAIDALVIDGDHSVKGVRADLADYGPLVRDGGLILLHDITPTTDPRAHVHEVWPELATRYETSEIHNPDGGFGWGVIHVREADRFEEARSG